jgi:hypothetical protein
MRSRCCLCVCTCVCASPLIVARQRLGKNPIIIARQQLSKNPFVAARQQLGRNVTAVMNTHGTIAALLDALFSMRPVSYQGKQAIRSFQNYLSFYIILCLRKPHALLAACFVLVSCLAYSSTLKMEVKHQLTFNELHSIIFTRIELFR